MRFMSGVLGVGRLGCGVSPMGRRRDRQRSGRCVAGRRANAQARGSTTCVSPATKTWTTHAESRQPAPRLSRGLSFALAAAEAGETEPGALIWPGRRCTSGFVVLRDGSSRAAEAVFEAGPERRPLAPLSGIILLVVRRGHYKSPDTNNPNKTSILAEFN